MCRNIMILMNMKIPKGEYFMRLLPCCLVSMSTCRTLDGEERWSEAGEESKGRTNVGCN